MSKRRKKNYLLQALHGLFHRRNIIVVSDKSVDHYPVGGVVQAALAIAVVGVFSFVSYISGSYMAAQTMLEEKDRKLFSTVLHNQQMDKEYSLLKRDLEKLQETEGELGEYARFVIDQHAKKENVPAGTAPLLSLEDSGEVNQILAKRVAYLEEYVTNLQDENAKIISLVQHRTQGKIQELIDIIELAGLDSEKVARKAREELAKSEESQTQLLAMGGQGGPFIPEDLTSFGEAFFGDIDQMMLLYSIVDRMPVAEPMRNARKTSGFGRRLDPFTKRWAMHAGLDYAGSYYGPVYATGNGVVVKSGRWGAYGNFVEIDHGFGITTRFGHLKEIHVKRGQKVTEGQQIGRQGSTGRSTGQHLHYEVRFNGRPLDPEKFLEAGSYVRRQS